jgi:UDP-GlcNAc:undecaprenyl-phosphate/decaprenyl-phosphate GlcNAc-1-phosphate transferase
MIWLLAAMLSVPSLVISLICVAIVKRMAARIGLLDKPNARKVHTTPIPLGGGLGVWAGLVVTFAVGTAIAFLVTPETLSNLGLSKFVEHLPGMKNKAVQLWTLLGCATVLMILGLMDDRRGLPWQLRLCVEFAVASVVVFGLGIGFTAFIDNKLITGLASVIWIVALINSFNMLDNMDGLSGGVAAIICAVLSVMLLSSPSITGERPQLFVACMMLVLLGSLLGFLYHNWPPASIFMGDAGSYLIGFWIAVATLLTTYTGQRTDTPHAVIAPLCVLAIPLYDFVSVIWIRLREGRSPFQADKRHFSHRLVDLGLSKKQAVFTIYVSTITTSLGAVLLQRTDLVGAIVIVAIVACVLSLIAMLEALASSSKDKA